MTITAINVTEFKARCLDMIRQVEDVGTVIDLTRHGKVVARLMPTAAASADTPPWLRLKGRGRLQAAPEFSVLDAKDFDANSDAHSGK